MRTLMRILLFVVCLNLIAGMVAELGLAGTQYVSPVPPTDNEEYPSHFNATEVTGQWQATPYSGIPTVGDIFSAFQLMWRCFQYLIVGFPLVLSWLGDSFITDAATRSAYNVVVAVLVGFEAVLATLSLLEFISGRQLTE